MPRGKKKESGASDPKAMLSEVQAKVWIKLQDAVDEIHDLAREARAMGANGIELAGRIFVVEDMLRDMKKVWEPKASGEPVKVRKPRAPKVTAEETATANGIAEAVATEAE